MAAIEVGRICFKKQGRETGQKAVIISVDKDFAVIDGPHIRRRKCNIKHLFPTNEKISIAKNASHEEIVQTFEKSLIKTEHKAQEHFKKD